MAFHLALMLGFLFLFVFASTRWLVSVGGLRMDVPNARSSHVSSTPRGGGAAFGFAILTSWLLLFVLPAQRLVFDFGRFSGGREFGGSFSLVCLVGFFLVGVTGGVDDYRGLPARVRFLIQVSAGAIVLWAGIRWRMVDFGSGPMEIPVWCSIILSLLWVVWNTNLYNFMDGINGIAGLNGVVMSVAIAVIAKVLGYADIFLAAVVMVPCLVAFLFFNLPKARIFMGDSGSLPLGFAFAVLLMSLHNRRPDLFTFWHGVILMGPFFFDATYTIIRRILRGERFCAAHRDHIYQKLALRTGSHGKIAVLYAMLEMCCAGSVVWMIAANSSTGPR